MGEDIGSDFKVKRRKKKKPVPVAPVTIKTDAPGVKAGLNAG